MKLEYKASLLRRVARHKGAIVLTLVLIYAAGLPQMLLEKLPRPELKARWACGGLEGPSSLPLFELLLSEADFRTLKPPIMGGGSAEVSVRYVDELVGTDAC